MKEKASAAMRLINLRRETRKALVAECREHLEHEGANRCFTAEELLHVTESLVDICLRPSND